MRRTVIGLAFPLAAAVAGCGSVSELVDPPKPIVASLEVWNRTREPVFLLDQDGRRLDVPSCGYAVAPQFLMNRIEVRTEQGFYFGTGTSGIGDPGRGQRMVITAVPGDSMAGVQAPPVLPPCEGRPEVQPGGGRG
ncbi:MAG: hypothetical protein FIA92_02890 [Chloroflexi bacterium]|nr:hypothetical protein [Chloroflexota bacterium]